MLSFAEMDPSAYSVSYPQQTLTIYLNVAYGLTVATISRTVPASALNTILSVSEPPSLWKMFVMRLASLRL